MPVIKTFAIDDRNLNRKYLIEYMPIEGGFIIIDQFRSEYIYLDIIESKELLLWMKECIDNQSEVL